MNNHRAGPPTGSDQSALSLLVNAADSHYPPRGDGMGAQGRSLADTLRLRSLAGDGGAAASLEEQLLLQQQQQQMAQSQFYGNSNLLSQVRDQNLLAQLGQHQQLASLLGLGGAPAHGNDIRSALAAQLRQQQQQAQPQLTQSDLLALSRSGGLSGLSGLFGGGGFGGSSGLASELEGLQRLEELERHQRLLAAGSPLGPPNAQVSHMPSLAQMQSGEVTQVSGSPNLAAGAPPPPPPPDGMVSEAALSAPPGEQAIPKEEVEKTPGSVIVPCRARGMPMDHNFKVSLLESRPAVTMRDQR